MGKFYYLACFLVLTLGLSSSALAQKKLSDTTYKLSENEKGVVGFFRIAGVAPDYEAWITATAAYNAIEDEKAREKFLVSESIRLGQGYSQFDPSQSFLKFSTDVIARYTEPADGKPGEFSFTFPEQEDNYTPVFPYPYGKNFIVLVINKFHEFSKLPLGQAEMEKVRRLMPYADEEYMAKLNLEVKLIRADYENPVVRNNIAQYMMLGDVAFISCEIVDPTSMRRTKAWEYVAPWYEEDFRLKNTPEEERYPHPYDLFKEKK